MSGDGPPSGTGGWRNRLAGRLRLSANGRDRARSIVDRALGADLLWSVALVACGLLLVLEDGAPPPEGTQFPVGSPAPFEVRAPRRLDLIDEAATAERRRAARATVPDVYVHDAERSHELVQALASVFTEGRAAADEAKDRLARRVPPDALAILARRAFDPAIERAATAALGSALDGLVIGNRVLLEREPSIVLLRIPGRRSQEVSDYGSFVATPEARDRVERAVQEALRLPAAEKRTLGAFVATFVDANVHYDANATEARRDEAARTVPPVMVRVERGAPLVRQGEIVTRATLERLAAARSGPWAALGWARIFSWIFVLGTLAFFVWRYASYHQRGYRKIRRLHALFVMGLLAMLLATRIVPWAVGRLLADLGPPFADESASLYIVPLGAGATLMALLANGRVATAFAGFATVLVTLGTRSDAYGMAWTMIAQLAGVWAIAAYRERAALLRAGLIVGTVGSLAAIAVEVLRGGPSAAQGALYAALLAWIGGAVGVGLLVSFALPPFEWLFHVLTDVRLLELSHANHPLLARLAVEAPGSYNHSLVVGTLAEEGAKAVGANGLLCRVAAFYHDIGKLSNPEFYVENQHGSNPHDGVDPRRSAEILASHVTDGIRMAREAGLPQEIVDIIPQHHGTRTMAYFLDKARRSSVPLGLVQEADFRYPGPKPQSREAAIFMIADAVEAAARTVDPPTAPRLHEMIGQVTQAIILDRQLDECDLTFADLERVQDALLGRIVSMHHQRIPYPGYDFGRASEASGAPAGVRR